MESNNMRTMEPRVHAVQLHDTRGSEVSIRHPPVVHVALGFDPWLPCLCSSKRPLITISDWQYEVETQEHFWEQALRALRDELKEEVLKRAIVIVAGDMASANNQLRGTPSDAPPNLRWLLETFPEGDVFVIYGNHDDMAHEHLQALNPSGLPCLLPQGSIVNVPLRLEQGGKKVKSAGKEAAAPADPPTPSIDKQNLRPSKVVVPPNLTKQERAAFYTEMTFKKLPKQSKLSKRNKQWRGQNPEQAKLMDQMKELHLGSGFEKQDDVMLGRDGAVRIGAVHGIPGSHNQGMKKIARDEYFQCLEAVCAAPIDILVTHTQPKFPGQIGRPIHGDDAPRIYENFQKSTAYLHVHGHMHMEPAVFINEMGKVIVNSDCRVVVFVPGEDQCVAS